MIEREAKEGVDSLIRFSELRVSIVTGSVSVGGRKRGTISAPLSFFSLRPFSRFFLSINAVTLKPENQTQL